MLFYCSVLLYLGYVLTIDLSFQTVDLSSEKVVHNLSLASGEKCVVCRCWKSNKFPLCDGAHVQHNKDTGDNLGPVIILGK